jgi:hypothetical protein
VSQIERLYNAIHDKLANPAFSTIVDDSLKCQIFGVFERNYSRWNEHMGKEASKEFVEYFYNSNIFREDSQAAIFRALLYFNLPYDTVIKKRSKPFKAFDEDTSNLKRDLKDLIEILEGGAEEYKAGKSKGDTHRSPNIILMQVEEPKERKTYIIGGYASH